jgi:hypothetical protein
MYLCVWCTGLFTTSRLFLFNSHDIFDEFNKQIRIHKILEINCILAYNYYSWWNISTHVYSLINLWFGLTTFISKLQNASMLSHGLFPIISLISHRFWYQDQGMMRKLIWKELCYYILIKYLAQENICNFLIAMWYLLRKVPKMDVIYSETVWCIFYISLLEYVKCISLDINFYINWHNIRY